MRIDEAFGGRLELVTKALRRLDRDAHAAGHAGIAPAREPHRSLAMARQQCEKRFQTLGVEATTRWQLPEERSELLAAVEDARGEEIRERLFDLAQPQAVGNEATAFHGEDETGWSLRVPARLVPRPLPRKK